MKKGFIGPAWKRSDALLFIEKNAGKQFDPEVSAALLAVINKKEVIDGIKDDTGAGYCAGRYCRDSDHVHKEQTQKIRMEVV